MKQGQRISILVADDDHEDRQLIQDALRESRISNPVVFVNDGEQLMAALAEPHPLPGLILLDLNMPKKDGLEALREIKDIERLRSIPVIVLTTSQAEEDILKSYNIGASSFISKPVTFTGLVEVLREIAHYWFEIVELPQHGR